MKSWIRITSVIVVLIGSVTFFGYWSINQFNQVFDDLNAAYLANTSLVYSSFKQKAKLAYTSPEMLAISATSTPETISEPTATTTPGTTLSTKSEQTTSTNLELSVTFPQKGDRVYIGCVYLISWQSPATISSLETVLIDAGTREIVGPIASGLAKENTIANDSQNLKWRVGVVWPGAYYIKISKINGVETEFRSKIFEINKMSENISLGEKENTCKESGGSF